MQNSSMLLVQPDEGVSVLVVDRIGDYPPQSTEKSRVLVIPVGARHKCHQAVRLDVGRRWPRWARADGASWFGRWPTSHADVCFAMAGSLRRSSRDGCATLRPMMGARLRQVAGRGRPMRAM
ncbi:Cytoplasmic dynein heavy chain [Dorcoceras hygrometricum]|uniref:Cytoplasmic dynein heavy chain n=1 Tax=Dorcoceras hygrometricum TaxID=472368 RepID=A0A2Z7AGK1_9LAMI|nr:Cytoplasmic dynein heavy chain [Dorcoceras hygrometricum]